MRYSAPEPMRRPQGRVGAVVPARPGQQRPRAPALQPPAGAGPRSPRAAGGDTTRRGDAPGGGGAAGPGPGGRRRETPGTAPGSPGSPPGSGHNESPSKRSRTCGTPSPGVRRGTERQSAARSARFYREVQPRFAPGGARSRLLHNYYEPQ
ncbi:uncharacterized protein PRD47_012722 [Ara ararauna]